MTASVQIWVGAAAALAGVVLMTVGLVLRARRMRALGGRVGGGGRHLRPSSTWRLVPTPENQWLQNEIQLKPGSYKVGRSPSNDILLDCRFVSREHARLQVADGWLSVPPGERHSVLYVRRAGESKYRQLHSEEGFVFDTGDWVAFNSPEVGMAFLVLAQYPSAGNGGDQTAAI